MHDDDYNADYDEFGDEYGKGSEGVEPEEEPKSKSQVKREMNALQRLGEKLVAMPEKYVDGIDMPERLRLAVREARRITKNEARRRQMQYIGTLMRDADPEPIEKAVVALETGRRGDARQFQAVESWRDRIIDGDDDLLQQIFDTYPDADIQRIRQLVRNARTERKGGKPPKNARELFRALRELRESGD